MVNIEKKLKRTTTIYSDVKNLWPTLQDWKESITSIFRGTIIGFFLGILPGGGGIMASFASYAVEKRVSKNPERFGKGAIQGVAGPESANNSAVGANFIPLMTLGIPTNVVMALILGALVMHGISPGPMLLEDHPDLFWGVVTSMYIGNVMLLILNLPLIGIWVRILSIPYRVLFPLILAFCLIGVYSLNNNAWEIIIMAFFGLIGYLMRKFEYEPAPFIFALVLSPIFENSLRQALLISEGSFTVFFTRPISCIFAIAGFVLFSLAAIHHVRRK